MPATYVSRLRLEGGVLAVTGIAASAVLLTRAPQARRWPASTIGQVALVAIGLAVRGPAAARRWMAAAEPVGPEGTTGEPTPLLHVPVPLVLGALAFKGFERLPGPAAKRAGWDASLRVTAGAAVVGLAQAFLLAPTVAAAEAREARVYHRMPGSRLGSGTRLGYVER